MKRYISVSTASIILISFLMLIGGCSGSGKGGSTGIPSGTTVVSGKVTLSSSVSKPALMKAMFNAPVGKPGSKAFHAPKQATNALAAAIAPMQKSSLSGAKVDMYDADHPEWLFPVATGAVDTNGDYSLSEMINSAENTNATYKDGDPIPAGRYTLVAYKFTVGQKPMASVQSLVQEYNGSSTVNFEIIPSDVSPVVTTMFGLKKNTDGTQTWGDETVTLPSNAAIQVSFSMPIWRDSLSGISIDPAVDGTWSLSPDWLTATFYPDLSSTATSTILPGTIYTVTVNGDDACVTCPKVTNVYENAVLKTAVGTFTATDPDTAPPVAQWNKPSIFDLANNSTVDITQSFRIEAPKQLDVNTLTLKGSPDIGAKPSVVFVGKNESNLYIYEFVLGTPLQLDTAYRLTMTGGKDLSGNAMNDLNLSVRTVKESTGVTVGQTQDWRNTQAAIKNVLGRWVQAMNDRNIGAIQGLMTGDFVMDYNASYGIDSSGDVNRDGKYSFAEFSNMMVNNAFPNWEYCETTVNYEVINDINYTPANLAPTTICPFGAECGDFQFKLTAVNKVNTQRCQDAAPKESLYAEVKYVNNAWKIVHASQGIDTRGGKSVSASKKIATHLFSRTGFFYAEQPDGIKLDGVPENAGLRIKLTWDAITDVASYALILIDARNPQQGMAWAFPPSVTEIDSRTNPADLGGVDVRSKFGLYNMQNPFNQGPGSSVSLNQLIPGGRYYWVVLGFNTAVANNQDVQYIGNKRINDLLVDVLGVSAVNTFSVAGVYQQLYVKVQPGSNPYAADIPYSEAFDGYNLDQAPNATLTIASPNYGANMGIISVDGSAKKEYAPVTFSWDQELGMYKASQEIALYKGVNLITVCDNQSYYYWGTLCKSFFIQTSGGIVPDIRIWEVIDSNNSTLSDSSGWNYFKATNNAQSVSINGSVSDAAFASLPADPINAGNKLLQLNLQGPDFSYASQGVSVSPGTDHPFTTAVNVYNTGPNWITISNDNPFYVARMGVYSTNGTVWVPDIGISEISDSSVDATPGLADKTADYGISSDWNADVDVSKGYLVTIKGKLKNPKNGSYNVQSDGGYAQGTLTVDGSGNFFLNVVLYNGMNFVNLFDEQQRHWYGLSILTSSGRPVIRPAITGIDGTPPVNGAASVTGCYAVISGTAESGPLTVRWEGSADGVWYSEYYPMSTDGNPDSTGKDTFTAIVPIVKGAGWSYNYVSVNDLNYRNISVQITTSQASCSYTAPQATVTAVKDDQGNMITPSGIGPGRQYDAGGSQFVTVEGTLNRSAGMLNLQGYLCNMQVDYPATTTNGTWSRQIPLYGGTQSYLYLYLYSGSYSQNDYFYVSVNPSLNTNAITPPIEITSVTGKDAGGNAVTVTGNTSCGSSGWDAGNASTITLIGKMQETSGRYQDTLGSMGQLVVAGGQFTITDVPVYQYPGSNNITIWDSKNRAHSVYVSTNNGLSKPKFIDITAPLPGATVSGVTPVTFTIDPESRGWTPQYIYGYTYDSCGGAGGAGISYSFNTYDGSIAPTVTPGEYTFSAPFTAGCYGYVDVYGSDGVAWHEMWLYVNTGDTNKYWSKPGKKAASPDESKMIWTRGMIFNKIMLGK